MGSFSVWHWLIILVALGIPAAIIGLIIWLVSRSSRSKAATAAARASAAPVSVESRLQELAILREKGLITDVEHEQQRAAVIQRL